MSSMNTSLRTRISIFFAVYRMARRLGLPRLAAVKKAMQY